MEYVFIKESANVAQLEEEIRKSSIIIALDKITLFGNELTIYFKGSLSQEEQEILENIVLAHVPRHVSNTNIITPTPFASKTLENNLKLFKRYVGIQVEVATGENIITYTIPHNWVKIMGLDIINCSALDKADFEVFDSTSGTYSGIPNLKLNQFGFSVNLPEGFFSVKSSYDSDLYLGMQIKLTYFSQSSKTIGINFDFHEVKQ